MSSSSRKIEIGQIWLDGTSSEIEILEVNQGGIYPVVGYCNSTKQEVHYLEDGSWSENPKYKELNLQKLIK